MSSERPGKGVALIVDSGIPIGSLFAGKYRIEGLLGRGGMGEVFAARHELLHQRVAIKVLRKDALDEGTIARFMNEARAAARIVNEHVARVTDVANLEDGSPYMVLEFLDGADLARVLEQQPRLPVHQVVDWVLQACQAVAQAHALGIVHRDLKPGNLFLAKLADGTSIIKVLDFGISKTNNPATAPSSTLTATGAMLGSPFYMAPEQVRNAKQVDARADVWALGVILYELLTAKRPFEGVTLGELLIAIVEQTPVPIPAHRPDVPPGLDEIVQRCLKRNPDERIASAISLAQALAQYGRASGSPRPASTRDPFAATAIAPGQPAGAPPPSFSGTRTAESWGQTGGDPARRPRVNLAPLWIATGGVILIVVAGLVYRSIHESPEASATGKAGPGMPVAAAVAAPAPSPQAAIIAPALVPTPAPLAGDIASSSNASPDGGMDVPVAARPPIRRPQDPRAGALPPPVPPRAPRPIAPAAPLLPDQLPDQSRR
jgi:serine/threonine protein kinase